MKDHARTPNRTRTPIRPPVLLASRARPPPSPASRCPCVLRAPPPGLRASAWPRPAPPVPRPRSRPRPDPGPAPSVPRPRPPGRWAAGPEDTSSPGRQVCARAWGCQSSSPRLSSPRPGPRRSSAPPAAAGPLGRREGAGLVRAQRAGGAAGDRPSPRGPEAGRGAAQAWSSVA